MSAPARVVIVGCGNVSDMHFSGYLNHPEAVHVVGACDPADERRLLVAKKYGITATFPTLEELISNVDFEIAVICTPSHVRLDTVRVLAAAGKHILVEKPMADTLEEAREIVDVCAGAGVKIAVDQNFRDHYAFGLAREAIQSGAIGRVFGIDQSELMFRQVEGWRAEAKHHALAVMGIHWFDGFRYLLDQDADWLTARTYSSPAMNTAGETDAFVQLHFGTATVNYTQSFSSHIERVETVVFGEKGTLLLGYDAMELVGEDGTSTVTRNPYSGNAAKPESAYLALKRLLDAVESGTEPENSGLDNLKTLSLMFGSYESAQTGQPVTLKNGLL